MASTTEPMGLPMSIKAEVDKVQIADVWQDSTIDIRPAFFRLSISLTFPFILIKTHLWRNKRINSRKS